MVVHCPLSYQVPVLGHELYLNCLFCYLHLFLLLELLAIVSEGSWLVKFFVVFAKLSCFYSRIVIPLNPHSVQSFVRKDKQNFYLNHLDFSNVHQKLHRSWWQYKQRLGRVIMEVRWGTRPNLPLDGLWIPSETTSKISREIWRYGWPELLEILKAFWPETVLHA